MTWLDNVYEHHRSSDMRVRSLKVGERDFWCVKGAKEWLSYDTELNCLPLFNKLQNYFIYPVFIPEIFLWSPAHIVLQVSKAFVDFFFYIFVFNVSKCSICSFTDARPSLFSVPQNCLEQMRYFNPRQIHHENMAQIHFTETNTQIHSKRANFITKYGSRKRGMGKYGPSKYQSERSDLPQDYLAIWYSSIVVPIYDMRYWPNLFGQDDWILAEFFFFSRFYGLGRSRGP